MARVEQPFWDAFHERWRADAPETEERVVRSVFTHLARRLPAAEAAHVDERLPPEVKGLWPGTEPQKRPAAGRPIERIDFDHLLMAVSDETGLPDDEAVRATRGVLHALARSLGEEERLHLSAQLPGSLRSVWDQEGP